MKSFFPIKSQWQKEFDDFCLENKIILSHPLRTVGIYAPGDWIYITGETSIEPYGALYKNSFFLLARIRM